MEPKRLDGSGRCCNVLTTQFSRGRPFCSVCYAEFGAEGTQAPNWAWRAVKAGFEPTRASAIARQVPA